MKTKNKFWNILDMDYKVIPEYLENMLEKGYKLVSLSNFLPRAKFIKTHDTNLKYYVDIFNYKNNKDDYISLCEDCGYTFVDNCENVYIFTAPKDKNIPPLQTNTKQDNIQLMKTIIIKNCISVLPILCLYIVIFLLNIKDYNYKVLLSYSSIFDLFFLPFFLLYSISYAIYIGFYAFKNYKYINKNQISPTPSLRKAILRGKLLNISLGILLVTCLLLYLGLFVESPIAISLILLSSIVFLIIFSIPYKKLFCNRKRNHKFALAIFLFVTISISVVSTIVILFISITKLTTPDLAKNALLIENKPVLELNDFYNIDNSKVEYSNYHKKLSPFIVNCYTYKEISTNKKEIETDYYKMRTNGLANIIYNGIIKENNYNYKTAGGNWKNIDKVVFSKDNNEYLLIKGNTVLRIKTNMEFNNNVIDIILKKINI